ncbi:hypothetical protein PVK06_021702 [Gossypium arboreum]|uniref:Uncharacterized protein n=1 Tax=Gossypium arboreum TaxID=29729 RepID=A0ABR0PRG5_GOSAR|nr:hypothetical protein PVK06_021702 [Gossypium arboreum]
MALFLATSRRRSLTNPSLLYLFSTSSNDPNHQNVTMNDDHSSNVKTNQHQKRPRNPTNPSTPNSKPMSGSASLLETCKNLSEFYRRFLVPSPSKSIPTPSQSQPPISLRELYKRNALAKQGESNESPDGFGTSGKGSMENIRKNIHQDSRETLHRSKMSKDEDEEQKNITF